MTWLDERIFGWSRSSKRGTSAWGGTSGTGSEYPSRIGTPHESDDEEAGDYDNVIGLLNVHHEEHHPKSAKARSRQNSYADLQRLRMAPLSAQGVPSPTIHHRERRHSLTDDFSVARIATVDQQELFADVTEDLNAESAKDK